jgi:hypothetical protein
MKKKLTIKSKRLRSTTYTLIANFIIFAFGICMEADLLALGTGLAALNAPLYVYLWGETTRKSTKK